MTLEAMISEQFTSRLVAEAVPLVKDLLREQLEILRKELLPPKNITAKTAAEMCGVSLSSWYDLVNDGYAPKPIPLSDTLKRWDLREVEAYLEARKALREREVS
jgi:predicted DNA-binding transcriptional regulator AlpA